MTIEDLEKLKKALPYGSIKKIARKLGITDQAVGQILNGQYNNEQVIDESLKILLEEKTKNDQRKKLLKKLI